MVLITERHKSKISGLLGCFDRVILSGTLPQICYADGMTSYLRYKKTRIFDYRKFTEPFGKQIRENAEQLAKISGIQIKHLNKSKIDKDDLVKSVLKEKEKTNETVEGLFFIISAMEICPTYKPWHNKETGKTYLLSDYSQCLHYYFYIMDKELGLCYVRVPTWLPFRLQIYFNAHNWLASRLKQEGIKYVMADNAFLEISNFQKAQEISDRISVVSLHKKLDEFARSYCPVFESFGQVYHWSIMQAEYATDIIFKSQRDLKKIYADLIATAIHTVKPENIATFLGRKLNGNYQGEAGNKYNVRREGSCIKHSMGKVSIKMYDKFQQILRIETTTNDVSFFKHYRMVEHKDGTASKKFTSMKKNIYSLKSLLKIMKASNCRYLEFISAIEDKSAGTERLKKVTRRTEENNRGYKGLNFFDDTDMKIIEVIARGEFNISGFRNKNLRHYFTDKSTGQISRILKRLKLHGLIKRARNSYKYYLTKLGKQVVLLAMKLKEMVIIPALNY